MLSMARPLPPNPLREDPATPIWIAPHLDAASLIQFGFRLGRSGVHQSKTMMLRELGRCSMQRLIRGGRHCRHGPQPKRIAESNRFGSAAGTRAPQRPVRPYVGRAIGRALARLWQRDESGRPLLALLCSLAREPPLRETATAVLDATPGSDVRWPDFASRFETLHADRYSANMLKSMSQNCASTWTQSGHLKGRVKKRRARATASPVAAAYAALLGEFAGFGGATLLASPWMRTLDRSEIEMMALLRQAEGSGLLRVRSAGDVVEIRIREAMASTLGVPELGNGR